MEERGMRTTAAVLVLLLLICAAGCGGSDEPAVGRAPFTAAIERYLKEHSMGMKVDEYQSLEVTGDTATGEVRMAARDVSYGVKPLWTFTFRKAPGGWTVVKHER
jgi:hypothetical protein